MYVWCACEKQYPTLLPPFHIINTCTSRQSHQSFACCYGCNKDIHMAYINLMLPFCYPLAKLLYDARRTWPAKAVDLWTPAEHPIIVRAFIHTCVLAQDLYAIIASAVRFSPGCMSTVRWASMERPSPLSREHLFLDWSRPYFKSLRFHDPDSGHRHPASKRRIDGGGGGWSPSSFDRFTCSRRVSFMRWEDRNDSTIKGYLLGSEI